MSGFLRFYAARSSPGFFPQCITAKPFLRGAAFLYVLFVSRRHRQR
nr:MAG TPA: hypothetical protein [Bacteriophage sp.]